MVGAYGVGEVLSRLEHRLRHQADREDRQRAHRAADLARDVPRSRACSCARALLGNIIGIIPGAGATIASFVSYGVEAQFGRRRKEMGTGVAEGIVAPQAAATASVGGALVPLLALGIPGQRRHRGHPRRLHAARHPARSAGVRRPRPAMVYTVFASLFIGMVLMCVLGYFAIRPLVKILDFPEAVVSAYVMILCFIGALSIRNNIIDLWLMIGFGVLGYLFERLKFPIAPLVLGVILGPLAEEAFMNSMISFGNDWTVFFTRPIAGTVMVFTLAVLMLPFVQQWRAKRVAAA